jgi:hypothetical protein
VHYIDAAGFDLILECGNASFRIDVKSTSQTYIGPRKEMAVWKVSKSQWHQYKTAKIRRLLTPQDCDMLALFHNAFNSVVYYPVVKPLREIRLPLSQVRNDDFGAASLTAAVTALRRGRGE